MDPDGNGFYPGGDYNTGEAAGKGLLTHMGMVQNPGPVNGTVFPQDIPLVRISNHNHLLLAGNFSVRLTKMGEREQGPFKSLKRQTLC